MWENLAYYGGLVVTITFASAQIIVPAIIGIVIATIGLVSMYKSKGGAK